MLGEAPFQISIGRRIMEQPKMRAVAIAFAQPLYVSKFHVPASERVQFK